MSRLVTAQPRESSADFFEEAYRRSPDPWNFAGSLYEQGRYDATMAALASRRFRHAFEPGCSVGVLTERLAGVSDRVDSLDLSATAVAQAQTRCSHLPQVHVRCGAFPPLPDLASVDLLVLSEIGYYFTATDFARIAAELVNGLASGATLIAVHWTGHSLDHQMSGDEVHTLLRAQTRLELELEQRHDGFRLDRWMRV